MAKNKEEKRPGPTIYGYCRVSSKGQARNGNSLEAQASALRQAGAQVLYTDVYTGVTTARPELERLCKVLQAGDTLIATKLDRLARSVQQGAALIDALNAAGVSVYILDMGRIDSTPTGKLIRNLFLSFGEFERDMILERTHEGKVASGNKGGRKPKFLPEQIAHAMELLQTHSYTEVVRMTGISKSTLIRAKRRSCSTSE